MTGFGRGAGEADGRAFVAELRAVNHRYLDLVVRLPRECTPLEERVRALLRRHVRRGHLEVTVEGVAVAPPGAAGAGRAATPGSGPTGAPALPGGGAPVRPCVDTELAAAYHGALREVATRLHVPSQVDASFFLGLPGVCSLRPLSTEPDDAWPALEAALLAAVSALARMRRREGEQLASALGLALGTVRTCLDEATRLGPEVAAAQLAGMRRRAADLLGEAARAPSPELVAAWATLLERAAIEEELVRLGSHLAQVEACLRSEEAVGRRLDFLAQEMLREWNTIAAKAADARLADLAVAARVAVEQVREQVQNVE